MDFVSTRLITDDIKRLVGFYEEISGLPAKWYTDDFAELATPSCTLAIGSTRTMALFGAGAAHAADNHTAIIEFRDRLVEWQNKPRRARRLFLEDLERWRFERTSSEETANSDQDAWVARRHHERHTSAASTESGASTVADTASQGPASEPSALDDTAALDDVAYALEYFTPFRSDDHACDDRDGHHFPEPPDRRARLRSFAAAYGLGTTSGLVDRVIARQVATVEHCTDLAERGVQPQKTWVEDGYLDELRSRVRWSRDHRRLFD